MSRQETGSVVFRDPESTSDLLHRLKAEFEVNFEGGRYPAALEAGRRLIGFQSQLQDPLGLAAAELAMGTVLMACGRIREARCSFSRARKLFRSTHRPSDLAKAYFNFGLDCGRMYRLSLAKAAFRHSAMIWRDLGATQDLRESQVLQAHTAFLQGNFEEAELFVKEVAFDLELLDPSYRVMTHLTEGQVFLSKGQLPQAEEAFILRFRAAYELGEYRFMADSLYRLAQLSQRRGDAWATLGLIGEAQACLAGLGHLDAEARLQAMQKKSQVACKPISLSKLFHAHPVRRSC